MDSGTQPMAGGKIDVAVGLARACPFAVEGGNRVDGQDLRRLPRRAFYFRF